jgi:hypothetical protein
MGLGGPIFILTIMDSKGNRNFCCSSLGATKE